MIGLAIPKKSGVLCIPYLIAVIAEAKSRGCPVLDLIPNEVLGESGNVARVMRWLGDKYPNEFYIKEG